ncbi:Hypothetical predicted protein [Octopus vulgaris]|uniref:Uncharacterized protein n=1 Tax=Octopus vulgaris TaxID=6645 RepID=A0AA36B7Z5_OCTVU|nr:Hypothetical predicted protein [Octopus vulgaris]
MSYKRYTIIETLLMFSTPASIFTWIHHCPASFFILAVANKHLNQASVKSGPDKINFPYLVGNAIVVSYCIVLIKRLHCRHVSILE